MINRREVRIPLLLVLDHIGHHPGSTATKSAAQIKEAVIAVMQRADMLGADDLEIVDAHLRPDTRMGKHLEFLHGEMVIDGLIARGTGDWILTDAGMREVEKWRKSARYAHMPLALRSALGMRREPRRPSGFLARGKKAV